MKFTFLLAVMISLISTVAPSSGWELKKDKEGIQVFTRKVADSPMRAFRGEMEIVAELAKIEQLFKDVSRYTEWSPKAKFAEALQSTPDKRIFYLQTDAPWPVTDRDGIYQFEFKPNADGLTILASCLPDYIPRKHKHIRITKSDGFWQFTNLENGKLKVVYENHSDPGGNIPGWLANSAVVDLPFESLKNLRQMLEN